MAERWRYAQGNHPAYYTCIQCVNSGRANKSYRSVPSLSDVLDRWRKRNFDPHFILGVPLATELTKRLNALRAYSMPIDVIGTGHVFHQDSPN